MINRQVIQFKIIIEKMEEVKSIEEFRDYLIGQKEGLQFALDMTNIQVKSLQNSITMIDEKLKKLEK